MNQIVEEDGKSRPDEAFYDFLIRIFFLKCVLYALIIWACVPAYTVPIVLWATGVPASINIFWTVISLAITYVLLILIGYPFILFYYKRYVANHWWDIEEEALIVQHGVFTMVKARIPYTRIQNLNIKQSWFQRLGGFYTIEVETAGATVNTSTGKKKSEGFMTGILDPEPIVEDISQHMLRAKASRIDPSGAGLGDEEFTPSSQGEILSYLKSIDKNLKDIAKKMAQ